MNDVRIVIRGRDEVVALQYNQVAKIPAAKGVHLTCRWGAVWVTQWGDHRDRLLKTGERLVLERPETAVLIALEPSMVRFQAPALGATLWQRAAHAVGAWLGGAQTVGARYY